MCGVFVDNGGGLKKSWDHKSWGVLSMMMNHDSICGSKLLPENFEPAFQLGGITSRCRGGLGDWWRILSAKTIGAKKLFFKTEISRFGGRLPMINQNGHWKLSLLVSNPFISTTSRKYQLPPKRNGLIRPYPPRKRPSCLFRYSLDLLNLFLKTCTLSSWWKPEMGIKSSLGPGISLVVQMTSRNFSRYLGSFLFSLHSTWHSLGAGTSLFLEGNTSCKLWCEIYLSASF